MSLPASSTQRIRQEMRARAEATRPQLARACGLSLVTVNRMVARLCTAGELEAAGEVSSGGGRPVQLYRLRRAASWAALLRLQRTPAGIIAATLEMLDPLGVPLQQEKARFAHLEENTLDAWLDGLLAPGKRRQLTGITLNATALPLPPQLASHLSARYHCPCTLASAAEALAETREGTATLILSPGSPPLATLYRNGQRHACGALELLPLPADWYTLDDSDHTLVEEMVARLLLMLSCTLAPERFVLYGTFWTERLLRRIRYNLATKLRGTPLPPLRFRRLMPDAVPDALRRLALEVREEAPASYSANRPGKQKTAPDNSCNQKQRKRPRKAAAGGCAEPLGAIVQIHTQHHGGNKEYHRARKTGEADEEIHG